MSHLLDVIISITFMFFLLSMLVSAILEFWNTTFRNKRATMLYDALLKALNDNNSANWAEALYNHPLIHSLKKNGKDLPTYIDAKSFSAALVDVFMKEQAKPVLIYKDGQPHVVEKTNTKLKAAWSAGKLFVDDDDDEVGAADACSNKSETSAGAAGMPKGEPEEAATEPTTTFEAFALKHAIRKIPHGEMRNLMLSFTNESASIGDVRTNIENWYQGYMDRVGGWYRRAQRIPLFVFSLIVAVFLNVDSVHVVKTLWQDDATRDKLVSDAIEYAEAHRERGSSSANDDANAGNVVNETEDENTSGGEAGGQQPATVPAESTTASANENDAGDEAATATGSEASNPGTGGEETPRENQNQDPETAFADSLKAEVQRIRTLYGDIASAAFPIGWNDWNTDTTFFGRAWDALKLHWLGWLLTALMLMQGAPFWFNVLVKAINIRGNGAKPKPVTAEK